MDMICGIDYGSKLAGTTVLAWYDGQDFGLEQSAPKQDADAWLVSKIATWAPGKLYVDAPLSLPAVYKHQHSDDYFYRQADRMLKAMSPMFLGGLTARAMRLAAHWRQAGWGVYEAYPAALWQELGKSELLYKKDMADLAACHQHLCTTFDAHLPEPTNWHQLDGLLALLTGLRHQQGMAKTFGDQTEGLIYV